MNLYYSLSPQDRFQQQNGFVRKRTSERVDPKRLLRLILILLPVVLALGLISPARANGTITHDYTANCSLLSISEAVNTGNGPGQGDQIGNCNSASMYAIAAGFLASSSSAEVKVKYVDMISVPYFGQSSTRIDLSGSFFALGYVSVNGAVGLCCGFNAASDLKIQLQVFGATGDAGPWTLQDWSQNCNGVIASSCGQFTTFDSSYSFSESVSVTPACVGCNTGVSIALTVDATASASATGLSAAQAQSCGQYHSGDCANPPSAVNGGNPPQVASSTCQTGISSPCYYVQWTKTDYTLTDQFNGSPDFGFTGPSSLTMNTSDVRQATLNLQSLNGYAGSVVLSVSGNPSTMLTDLNPPVVQLAESGGGQSILTLTTSSTTPGVCTLTVLATGNSVSHYVKIAVTVNSPSSGTGSGTGGGGGDGRVYFT